MRMMDGHQRQEKLVFRVFEILIENQPDVGGVKHVSR
jgi:hypothetical protein